MHIKDAEIARYFGQADLVVAILGDGKSVASIKRLVRNATAMPLAEGLALERDLFLKLANQQLCARAHARV